MKLSLLSQITVEALIQYHTLYPFYAAFLPQARSQQLLEAMRDDFIGSFDYCPVVFS